MSRDAQLNVRVSADTKQAQTSLTALSAAVAAGTAVFATLKTAATLALVELPRKLLEGALTAERNANAMNVLTGSYTLAAKEQEFLRQTAQRLGLELNKTTDGYIKLMASARGTVLEGQATRDIFTAVAGAASTLGLSAATTDNALLAIAQMMGKGVVSAEEMRGQLAEALPGAMQISARAMGVTTAKLGDMMEKGEVLAADLLPKFAAQLGKEIPANANGTQAALNRVSNAAEDIKQTVGSALVVALDEVLNLKNASTQLSRENGLVAFAEQSAMALAFLLDAASGIPKTLATIRDATASLFGEISFMSRGVGILMTQGVGEQGRAQLQALTQERQRFLDAYNADMKARWFGPQLTSQVSGFFDKLRQNQTQAQQELKGFEGGQLALAKLGVAAASAGEEINKRLGDGAKKAKDSIEKLTDSYKAAQEIIKANTTQRNSDIEAGLSKVQQAIANRYSAKQINVTDDAGLEKVLVRYASESQAAAASTRAVITAEQLKMAAARDGASASLKSWQETHGKAIELAKAAGKNAKDLQNIEREGLQAKLAIYQQIQSAYKTTIDRLISEENRHLEEVRRIEQERLSLRLSVEDRIRALQQKGMEPLAAYQDKQKQIEEKTSQARRALANGDAEAAKQFAEQAMQLAEGNANAVEQNGRTVVSQSEASAKAIAQIRDAASLADQALVTMGQNHAQAAAQAGQAAAQMEAALAKVSAQAQAVQASLAQAISVKLTADTTEVDKQIKELKALVEAQTIVAKLDFDIAAAQAMVDALQKDISNKELKFAAQLFLDRVYGDIETLKATATATDLKLIALANFDQPQQALVAFDAELKKLNALPPLEVQMRVVDNVDEIKSRLSELNGMKTESTHTVYVRQVEQRANGGLVGAVARFAQGGQVLGQAWRSISGRVFGPGTGTSDSVPAMLSAGEFVVKSDRVRQYGVRLLQAINSGRFAYDPNPTHLTAALTMARDVQRESVGAETTLRLLDTVEGPIRLTSTRDEAQKLVRVLQKAGVRFA